MSTLPTKNQNNWYIQNINLKKHQDDQSQCKENALLVIVFLTFEIYLLMIAQERLTRTVGEFDPYMAKALDNWVQLRS